MRRKNEINTKKSNQQQIGICHRLYNLILNTFFSPTLKTLTIGHTLDSDNDHQRLLQDQSRHLRESSLVTSPEIVVEFRHDIDSNKQKEHDEITRVDIMKPQEVQETKVGEDFKTISISKAKGKDSTKTLIIKENTGEYRKDSTDKQHQQQKDKNIVPVSRDEAHLMKKHKVPRLLSVDRNINEISEAFIRSKKAAMRRTYSHDVNDL